MVLLKYVLFKAIILSNGANSKLEKLNDSCRPGDRRRSTKPIRTFRQLLIIFAKLMYHNIRGTTLKTISLTIFLVSLLNLYIYRYLVLTLKSAFYTLRLINKSLEI